MPRPKPWTQYQVNRLGTATDSEVAKKIGRSPEAVTAKRHELKIPPFTMAKFIPSPAQKRQLGKHPDQLLAEMWGVARITVLKARQALGIKCYGVTSPKK